MSILNLRSALSALALSTIVLVLTFLAYSVLGFETFFLFKSALIFAPLFGISATIYFLCKNCSAASLIDYLRESIQKTSALKALILAFLILLFGGLFADIVRWSIPANEIDHGECVKSYFYTGIKCGLEDLNADRRTEAVQIVFRTFAFLLLVFPAVLLNSRASKWLTSND